MDAGEPAFALQTEIWGESSKDFNMRDTRISMDERATLRQALQQMVVAATQILAVLDATDFLEVGPRAPRREAPVAVRIEKVLMEQGVASVRRIKWELAHDGHGEVTHGCASGTLDTMKKRGLVTLSNGLWRLAMDESLATEPNEQEAG
ncbi:MULTISPECIES: hypothetical protein [unclassified Acidocella]|uniref:hypothetical protein n=1 Tax=unclassified Acidocella TaxID=2648610 RepID=UPI00028CEB47|nr:MULTISPECIES: hypothetical protein [unclassified Acidocella]EKM99413.1 hypothetical protein MXAZACID_10498 [Acidocella sp. MX-AZ02]WBO58071.1 hypothetical protein GT370_12450 [Acidocella sp. MX-AZ03]